MGSIIWPQKIRVLVSTSSQKRCIKKSRRSREETVKKCVMHVKVRKSVMHVQKFFSLKPSSAFLALSLFSSSRFAKDSNKQTKGLKSKTTTYRTNRLAHREWDLKMNRSRLNPRLAC